MKSERMAFVELGRKRLIVQVPLPTLAQAEFEPSAVITTCQTLGVTGIVLCARGGNDSEPMRARHFTTSLKGTEDPVTGGAAGAILGFIATSTGTSNRFRYTRADSPRAGD